ncbi:MAG: peroxiredoxin [Sandaracinaceae bacterium]|nr:peroxiredoxin [Sandaracinaceae bacterium]
MSLKLGTVAPDFSAETTEGPIQFHDWAGSSWVVFFSHPADYTPVCTTELGMAARLKPDFEKRNCKILAVSVDPLDSHMGWLGDIEETQSVKMNYPIVADPDQKVARLYNMIHEDANAKLTVRSVFFIDPSKKVRATITYPPATGRNFDEILRVIDGLQLTDSHQVATPVNWKDGDDVVIVPSITDAKEIAEKFPKGHKELKPYLRMTPQPNR